MGLIYECCFDVLVFDVVDSHREQLQQLHNDVANERQQSLRYQQESEKSKTNLLEFAKHGITVEKHLQLSERLASMKSNQNVEMSENDGELRARCEDLIAERDCMARRFNKFRSEVVQELRGIRQNYQIV